MFRNLNLFLFNFIRLLLAYFLSLHRPSWMAAQLSSVLTLPPKPSGICRLHRSALSWLLQVIEKMLKMTDPRTPAVFHSLTEGYWSCLLPVLHQISVYFHFCFVHVLLLHLSLLSRKSSLHHSCHVLSHYSCRILATPLHCNCSRSHLFLLLFLYIALVFVQAFEMGPPSHIAFSRGMWESNPHP